MRKNKMYKKKGLFTKISVALLIVLMIIPIFSIPVSADEVSADAVSDPLDWYAVVNGVLGSDTYSHYPFREASLDIGFSKFGEMIGLDSSTVGVGLQYPGMDETGTHLQTMDPATGADAFANELIPMHQWVNGWLLDVKYGNREVWAFALFSDFSVAGKDWITMPSGARPDWQQFPPFAHPSAFAYDPVLESEFRGGRKTNGICVTDPLRVLYDGPRKWIGQSITHVSDIDETPLVDVRITCIFDKAEKHVILLKDVKVTNIKDRLNIQFGNRGQWDLDIKGYAHFYTDEPVQWWDLDGNGTIELEEEEASADYFREFMIHNKYPKKWWSEVYYPQNSEAYMDDFDRLGIDDPMTDAKEWLETQRTTYNAYEYDGEDMWHTDQNIHHHGYAVAQVIDQDLNYVGALAVWPHPEFWTVEDDIQAGWNDKLTYLPLSRLLDWDEWDYGSNDPNKLPSGEYREPMWIKVDDMNDEPGTPWIMYEHDFELEADIEGLEQYRVVSVYVLTDYHDADDVNAYNPSKGLDGDLDDNGIIENKIDREIRYQLEEVFNSWDLRKAMRKETWRWIEYFTADGETIEWCVPPEKEVEAGLIVPTIPLESVHDDGMCAVDKIIECGTTWDEYCVPSEKVLVDGILVTPLRALEAGATPKHPDLTYVICPCGCFVFLDLVTLEEVILPEGTIIQISWSSRNLVTKAMQVPFWTNTTGRYQLHHDVRPELKDMTEVIEVFDDMTSRHLMQGEWVWNDDKIFLKWPLDKASPWWPETLWLWILDNSGDGPWPTGITIMNADDALDYFKTVFPAPAISGAPPSDVIIPSLNETYIPIDVWDALNPKPIVGDWMSEGPDISAYGEGIIVDIQPPNPDKEMLFAEIEFVHIDPSFWEPMEGEYVIHETEVCDEVVLDNRTGVVGDWLGGHGPLYPELKIVYKFWQGRYEHVVVGKDARSVDSIGAAMVSAAIKNKNLEVGMGALDMMDPDYKSRIPWVFRKFGEGYTWDDYYYGAVASDWAADDERVALKDDWCTNWAVAGSNMIGVGGPLANMLSYYGNDFMQALFGIPRFTPDPVWSGRIAAPTCWDMLNRHFSSFDDEDLGYAVIATQKDKNNTIMLNVWGHFARDTYWASQWFEFNKFKLQHMNPHVTAIILEIDYDGPTWDADHPKTVIIEKLGTISEKPVHEDP
jgi:hypothetical protein